METAEVEGRAQLALRLLAQLHDQTLPPVLTVAEGIEHPIPSYDLEALLIEVELLVDWYVPHIIGTQLSGSARAEFVNLWTETLGEVLSGPVTWTLRDYHSPNLIWLPQREGLQRVGMIDFQDAVLGPPAYDVASLLQDARVDVPVALEDLLVSRYLKARRAADREFDQVQFVELYARMGAQRATKILGIFARLDRRDGKPQYLRHQPRVWRSLRRSLAHPTLTKLKAWYDANVPPPR